MDLCDAVKASIDSFRANYPKETGVTIHRGENHFDIQGEGRARSIKLLEAEARKPARIAIFHNDEAEPYFYFDFASDGTDVWLTAKETRVTADQASRIFAEDVLFPE